MSPGGGGVVEGSERAAYMWQNALIAHPKCPYKWYMSVVLRERKRTSYMWPNFLVFQKEMRKAYGLVLFFILLQIDLGGPVLQCLPAP